MSEELTVQPAGDAFLSVIIRAANDPQTDVSKMRELLDMVQRVKALDAEKAFAGAMTAAQSDMAPIVRDAQNSHTQSKYARLETIDARIRPIYTGHGFSLSFNSVPAGKAGSVRLNCRVRHCGGHSEIHELEGDLDIAGAQGKSNKTSIQGLGSSVSYLRRYLTVMIFNLALINEDDDGSGAAPINGEQFNTLHGMMDACELDSAGVVKFLDFCGVGDLREVQRRDYSRALQALRTKLRKIQESIPKGAK